MTDVPTGDQLVTDRSWDELAAYRARVRGNLIGAHHGDVRLPQHWLARIEGRATIAMMADDCAAEVYPGEHRPWNH